MMMKGFTLIESLVVLFICSIFLLIPTLAIKKWQSVLEVEQFLNSLEKKILFTQQMAVVTSQDTQILFFADNQCISFFTPNSEEKLVIPPAMEGTGPQKIIFKKRSGNNGNLSKYTFRWAEKNQIIEFQFQLGSGRYVKKIKKI